MSGDSIRIERCRAVDIEAVLALWRRAYSIPHMDQPWAVRLRLERDPNLFLLAWDGDRLVGSLMGGWDGWRGNMYRAAVDPAYLRRGVARRLVEAVELELRAMGAERITSLVALDEPGATDFWQSVGYRPDPAVERYAKDLA